MLKNYIKIVLRRLRRQPLYTFINVLGLAVGMACCLLIGLYVQDELSFDRFHEHADRLTLVGWESPRGTNLTVTPYPAAPTLIAEVPEAERAVRTIGGGGTPVIREETQLHSERRVLLADPAFFEVFSFPLIHGDPSTVLNAPDAAVITEALAHAYFGEENPIGKTLHVRRYDETYEVTVQGIAQDAPSTSTIQFDVVASLQLLPDRMRDETAWNSYMYRTYVLLEEGTSVEVFSAKAAAVLGRHYEHPEPPSFFAVGLPSLYLSDLHEPSGFRGQARYLYLFGSIALFVLLIAAINYINLVTAQATRRALEVGVRKTLGAARTQLVRQFLSESVLLSMAALIVAMLLVELALPAFNVLFEKELVLNLQEQGRALFGLSVLVLLIGVAAGSYPALVLSRFQPVRVLRGAGASVSRSSSLLRKGLVVVQFAISVALIVGTAVMYEQLHYVQEKHLGFDEEQVVLVELPDDRTWRIREALKQSARSHPGVLHATVANAVPGHFPIRLGEQLEKLSPRARTEQETVMFAPAVVDHDFIETLGMRLLAGRDFSREHLSDEARAYILNETAVKQLGWTSEEAVGRPFKLGSSEAPDGEVIGVVEDFHIASLHQEIEPVALQLREDPSWSASGVLIAKLAPEAIRDAMDHLERQLVQYAPGEPFKYQFLDDVFEAMYRTEKRLSQIFTSFALLAVFIACLGLFGLAAYAAETRTKEIGIRKVLGASVTSIVTLLSKDFLRLVLIAIAIAAPAAYFAMSRWLESFAYRIDLGTGIFLLAGGLALLIALATVSYQALRAALADPVKSLRYE